MTEKRLYKSYTNRKLCGVCGGLGEYFNIDPTIVRLIWILLTFAGGSGILFYLISALIISDDPRQIEYHEGENYYEQR